MASAFVISWTHGSSPLSHPRTSTTSRRHSQWPKAELAHATMTLNLTLNLNRNLNLTRNRKQGTKDGPLHIMKASKVNNRTEKPASNSTKDPIDQLSALLEKQEKLLQEIQELQKSISTIRSQNSSADTLYMAKTSSHVQTDVSQEEDVHAVPYSSRARSFGDIDTNTSMESIQQWVEEDLVNFNKRLPPRDRMSQSDVTGFKSLFSRYLKERSGKKKNLVWEEIQSPSENDVVPYSHITQKYGIASDTEAKRLLKKVAVLKLNGGLGTSMGCVGPKSAIEVVGDQTFMDLTVQQIQSMNEKHDVQIPLLLMNSFNTHSDTEKILQKYKSKSVDIIRFYQSRFPRIQSDSLSLLPTECYQRRDSREGEGWFPPGHGDVYQSLLQSGLLDNLLSQGREYLFISNIDNLGGTVDINILKHMDSGEGPDYAMELTDKTIADVKGGTLITYQGRKKLLEIAQVPKGRVEEFKSVRKFRVFNTNNLWVNLRALKKVLEKGDFEPDLIVNRKNMSTGQSVIQLETAAGAFVECFEKAQGINVPRSRFLPVKTTSDLFAIQSNLYSLDPSGNFIMSPRRQFSVAPHVKLGEHFQKVSSYNERLGNIPDIVDLEHLTVSGNVTFGKNVTLRGTVIIVANPGSQIDIPEGAILENKVISGNLNILVH